MRRAILAAAATAVAVAAARAAGPSTLPAGLEAQVRQSFAACAAPGLVYGLYRGPDLTPELVLPLGYADERHARPISLDDHFRIASLSKVFVGTVVLQLLDEGKLGLSDTIDRYVPGVPGGDRITLKMLGNHTSGLPMSIANPEMQKQIQARPSRAWTDDEILAFAWQIKPPAAPGEKWFYSNTNTLLLAKVIQKVTGHDWKHEVKRRVIDRLGLKQTGFPGDDGRLPEPFPRGYRFGKKDNLVKYGDFWFDATDWSTSCYGAAGDMYATVHDVAVVLRVAARGELVGDAGRRALFDWYDTKYEGVESGFHLFRRDGGIGSTGDVAGYSAWAFYLPDSDRTIVCLANLTATPKKETAASLPGEATVRLLGK